MGGMQNGEIRHTIVHLWRQIAMICYKGSRILVFSMIILTGEKGYTKLANSRVGPLLFQECVLFITLCNTIDLNRLIKNYNY